MSDIIIIGGGIAGISAAAQIAPHAKVTVLEREDELAYHASGRSAAAFIEDYGNAVVRELNSASVDYLTNANGGVLSKRGMMLLAKKEEKEDFQSEAKSFGLNEISKSEAKEKIPLINTKIVSYSAYRKDVSDIDTDLLFQNFLKEARSFGALVHTKAEVNSISFEKNRWNLITTKGEYSGEILINATGAWADHTARMAGIQTLKFTPYRRSIARIPVPGGFDPTDWPLFGGVNESWYAKPDAGQLIVSPAEEDPLEPQDAWADDIILAEGIARFEELMEHPVERITSNWAGLRTFSPDRSLVIGPAKDNPHFYWLCGQGGYGFQTAAAASQLTSDIILSRPTQLSKDVCEALSPKRFL